MCNVWVRAEPRVDGEMTGTTVDLARPVEILAIYKTWYLVRWPPGDPGGARGGRRGGAGEGAVEVQAQTCPAGPCLGCAGGPEEAIEKLILVLRGDAHPVVGHRHLEES